MARLLESKIYTLAELIKERREKQNHPRKEAHTGIYPEERGIAGNIGKDVQTRIWLT